MARVEGISLNSPSISLEKSKPVHYWTTAKVQKVALYSMATVVAAGTVSALLLSTAWPVIVMAIPAFVASLAFGYLAWGIKDYEDPAEVKKMGEKALELSFSQIVEEHGWNNVRKIISQPLLQQKFQEESIGMSFRTIDETYSVDLLLKQDLIISEDLKKLFTQETRNIPDFYRHFSSDALRRYCSLEILTEEQQNHLEMLRYSFEEASLRFKSETHRLDRLYARRQDRLLDDLEKEEKAAYRRAYERKKAVRDIGDAATGTAIALRRKDFLDSLDLRVQGEAFTDLAMVPTQFLSNQMLEAELAAIQATKRRIHQSHIGSKEQQHYDEGMAKAKAAYDLKIKNIAEQIDSIQ